MCFIFILDYEIVTFQVLKSGERFEQPKMKDANAKVF